MQSSSGAKESLKKKIELDAEAALIQWNVSKLKSSNDIFFLHCDIFKKTNLVSAWDAALYGAF